MGHTLKKLSERKISAQTIFNNRFVVEICEKVHVHYRNLRINLSLDDFIEVANGFISAMQRWQFRGQPEPGPKQHIELTRRRIGRNTYNDNIQVNLNTNLYNKHKDQIFAEGADFKEEVYCHLKIRDLRIELSMHDFKELADAVEEAKAKVQDSNTGAVLQET